MVLRPHAGGSPPGNETSIMGNWRSPPRYFNDFRPTAAEAVELCHQGFSPVWTEQMLVSRVSMPLA
jgi:hypothetical protein